MQELKFKAYIKSLHIIVDIKSINFDCKTVEVDLSNGQGDVTEYNLDEVGIMQYTGLRDMNKKQIYEGDIIELLCGVGVVKIGDCAFQSYGDNDQHSCICVYIEYANGVKEVLTQNIMGNVVGNIYEKEDKE